VAPVMIASAHLPFLRRMKVVSRLPRMFAGRAEQVESSYSKGFSQWALREALEICTLWW
jgi:hypothetical protein